ncbi:MAG: hypothetical protein IMY73_04420 [Bacteroidetes bacterium]|nr:hypothetical protein [Bacteroidota bacterium]
MKKTNYFLMMLCAMFVCITSCSKNSDPVDELKSIDLTISEGESIVVDGADIVKIVTISSSDVIDRDVKIVLSLSEENSVASLSENSVILSAGTQNATVSLTFLASAFPPKTVEKKITLSVTTENEKVQIEEPYSYFYVKGTDGEELPAELTVGCTNFDIDVTSEKYEGGSFGIAKYTLKLSKKLKKDLTISTFVHAKKDICALTSSLDWSPIITKGKTVSKEIQVNLSYGLEEGSLLPIYFTTEKTRKDVVNKTTELKFKIIDPTEPTIFISPLIKDIKVGNVDGDDTAENLVETITISLSKKVDKDINVKLKLTSDEEDLSGVLSETDLIIEKGTLSKTATVTFDATKYLSEDNCATVTVTATTDDVVFKEGSEKSIFNVCGAKAGVKQKMDCKIECFDTRGIVFVDGVDQIEAQVYISPSNRDYVFGSAGAKIDVNIDGLDALDYEVDKSYIIFNSDKTYDYYKIRLNRSSIDKEFLVSLSSDQATISKTKKSVALLAGKSIAPEEPLDYKIWYTLEEVKDLECDEATSSNWLYVEFESTFAPDRELVAYLKIEGDVEINYDVTKPIIITKFPKKICFLVNNFENLENGAKSTITFTSDYVTFAENSAVTITIKK